MVRPTDETEPVRADLDIDEGGEGACYAHLVCAECGRIPDPGEDHHCTDDPTDVD